MRQRRRSTFWFIVLFSVSLAILSAAWLYMTWQSSEAVLPPGLTINGLPMGGMLREQALAAIEQAYTVPVSVTYGGEAISPILPEIIELRVDMVATAENLDEALVQESGGRAFIEYTIARLRRETPEAIEVNAVALYSRERVDAYLERTAQRYDHPPMQPVALPEQSTFRPATEGTQLNIEASVPLLIAAILAADPSERQVDLVVATEPAPESSTEILSQALMATLADFSGVAGIFAKDLATGQELCINCDVAFAGLSTMKIGIAVETYRLQELPLDAELASLMKNMLIESDNAAANQLLATIGAGNPYSGALQVTDLLWSLGLSSSFLAVPYDLKEGVAPPEITTPANLRTDITTEPDPYIQTTPLEAGLLLQGLYQCSRGGGYLRALYPQTITPAECQEVLAWMERNQINSLLSAGMPPGTTVIHKHGWRGDTHADVSLVYSPQADFILVTFLYQPEWLVWEESVPTFSKIGELTYRFFSGASDT
ncbi:MAG: class A beta-lactamase-related serine hydrolase [Anaerolineae bacterium]|nr:class A beta-lactamase-related serine hydrolase [Anaerolineae bacterium]